MTILYIIGSVFALVAVMWIVGNVRDRKNEREREERNAALVVKQAEELKQFIASLTSEEAELESKPTFADERYQNLYMSLRMSGEYTRSQAIREVRKFAEDCERGSLRNARIEQNAVTAYKAVADYRRKG